MRKILIATALAALAAGTVVPTVDAAKTTKLKATLSGKAEGGKGDANGKGHATLRITSRRICFTIEMENINGSVAAHIHKGKAGVNGPVLVPLLGSSSKKKVRTGCSGASKGATPTVIKAIKAHPGRYYVNVHNADFPDGAIRGQLHR
jgi:hypothetical protein